MKNNSITRFIIAIVLFSGIFACSSSPTDKLIGTWRAADVVAAFDEQIATPEMLKQVIQVEKQLFFKFQNDSMMNIHTMDQTLKAYWFFDEESGRIDYRFAEMASSISELGIFKVGKSRFRRLIIGEPLKKLVTSEPDEIKAESQTALGKLTITYRKE
jgi:hypothetical protein